MIKLSKIILASIIALVPLNVLAQNNLTGFPEWARNRGKPDYTKIYSDTYFTYAIDNQYILLNNGNHGVILYMMGHSQSPMFSRTYYEFNCRTGRYSFKGEVVGQLINGTAERVEWTGPCNSEECEGVRRISNGNILSGIKKYCPH